MQIEPPHPRWHGEIGNVRGVDFTNWADWATDAGHDPNQLICINIKPGTHRLKIRHQLIRWCFDNGVYVNDGPIDHHGHAWTIIRREHLDQVTAWAAQQGWARSLEARELHLAE
ncbi:hypothetical protein [Micromonospora sp. LH3U1]|uniref:hypothetical protein n=1 Tax=Micromonospora sp. LH3U1 TaxID=3018339 RepID=UPI00234ADB8A|nr:hypothetical protein [Micromonospora sp. LH3U1]WCN80027.1 hypothetical protein PCA76_24170 [Micromonospora sp. LH3U1]